MNSRLQDQGSIAEAVADFECVLANVLKAKNAGDGRPADRRGVIADTLFLRGMLAGQSIHQLLHPQPIRQFQKLGFPDFASIETLARSILESYLTMHSVALQPRTQEEAEIRLLWWNWHLLKERIRALEYIHPSHPHIAVLDHQIPALKAQLSGHALFQTIPNELAKAFLNGKRPKRPLFEKWPEIANEAGIDPSHFKSQYQMLSGTAHSEPWIVWLLEKHDPHIPEISASLRIAIRSASAFLGFMTSGVASINPAVQSALDQRFNNLVALWRSIYATPFQSL